MVSYMFALLGQRSLIVGLMITYQSAYEQGKWL